jgi:hypothetical protein
MELTVVQEYVPAVIAAGACYLVRRHDEMDHP